MLLFELKKTEEIVLLAYCLNYVMYKDLYAFLKRYLACVTFARNLVFLISPILKPYILYKYISSQWQLKRTDYALIQSFKTLITVTVFFFFY